MASDGRVRALVEVTLGGVPRPIPSGSPEAVRILMAGNEVVYRFADERRLRDLPYPRVLEAMRQEVLLTLHKVRHGDLLDEPEMVPLLRRLLRDLDASTAAFQEACRSLPADT